MNNKEIGRGMRARVFSDGQYAYKVYDSPDLLTGAFFEAAIISAVANMGLPTPRAYEVTERDGAPTIKMDLIEGKTFLELLTESSASAEEYIDTAIALQLEVHKTPSPVPFSLKSRIAGEIRTLDSLSEKRRDALLATLDALPDGDRLCHMDFHGLNLMRADKKDFIIDWVNACSGAPAADVCRSYLIHLLQMPQLSELYLDSYVSASKVQREEIFRWLPVLAAARLSEDVPGEKEGTGEILDKYLW